MRPIADIAAGAELAAQAPSARGTNASQASTPVFSQALTTELTKELKQTAGAPANPAMSGSPGQEQPQTAFQSGSLNAGSQAGSGGAVVADLSSTIHFGGGAPGLLAYATALPSGPTSANSFSTGLPASLLGGAIDPASIQPARVPAKHLAETQDGSALEAVPGNRRRPAREQAPRNVAETSLPIQMAFAAMPVLANGQDGMPASTASTAVSKPVASAPGILLAPAPGTFGVTQAGAPGGVGSMDRSSAAMPFGSVPMAAPAELHGRIAALKGTQPAGEAVPASFSPVSSAGSVLVQAGKQSFDFSAAIGDKGSPLDRQYPLERQYLDNGTARLQAGQAAPSSTMANPPEAMDMVAASPAPAQASQNTLQDAPVATSALAGAAEAKALEGRPGIPSHLPASGRRSATGEVVPAEPGMHRDAVAGVPAFPLAAADLHAGMSNGTRNGTGLAGAEAAPATAAARALASDPFTAMDGGASDSSARILHASQREVEVGVHDPTYGWVEIKTHLAGGQVSASLAASSSEAHHILQSQLPAMAEYLSNRDIAVNRLSVAAEGAAGFGASDSPGGGHSQPQSGTQEQPATPAVAPAPASRQTPAVESGANLRAAFRGSSRIDVMA